MGFRGEFIPGRGFVPNSSKGEVNEFGKNGEAVSPPQPEVVFRFGHVVEVFPSDKEKQESRGAAFGKPDNISPSQVIMIKSTLGLLPSNDKKPAFLAKPLLRGFNDSISTKELVLWTSIAGKCFYLGPLNTFNSSNVNPDHTFREPGLEGVGNPNSMDLYQMYPGWPLKPKQKKLEKIQSDLDYPDRVDAPGLEPGSLLDVLTKVTDTVIEGRHGNSIRLGSRQTKPQLIISNERTGRKEDSADGANISLMSIGSISQVLDYDKLGCDQIVDEKKGNPRKLFINHGNDPGKGEEYSDDEDRFDYNYGNPLPGYNHNYSENKSNQIIMFSDRITFDAKRNDLTFSAHRNINLGAGKNFTLMNRGFSVIETNNIYLGKEAKKRAEPMVLGSELKILLINILEWLKGAHSMTQAGPQPLIDVSMAPFNDTTLSEWNLTTLLEELNKEYNPQLDDDGILPIADRVTGGPKFFSNYHFIEPNLRPEIQTEES